MSDELQPGDLVGDYTLEQRLGGGGFGAVWRATQTSTGKTVALKVLRTDVYSTDTLRLRSEVELLAATASSRSPHVVKVLSGGIEPQPFVVMEFIEGVDLGKELERRKRIPQLEVIRIGAAVANALAALESVGIIHRDIKPANVMVDVDGVVKLTDFGIAKIVGFDSITATSQMPMSMAYAAPEAWEGQASHQSDLYSLGCLLFQCLAGRPPFTGSPAQLFREHTTKDPDWTLLPEGTVQSLRDLLRACLAKDPGERPRDSASVAEQLAEAERELDARVAGSTATDLPAHEPQAFGPWLRREKHPAQPWAFLCIHETTGEKATVEIHFSDDIEYGARLRKAVEVNPKLVPLGAERLLGTNRLVLRPGEAWVSPPSGQFQFWVAREELPLRPSPTTVDDATLQHAAAGLAAVREAAAISGIDLTLPPESLHLMPGGTVMVRRPGLAFSGDDGMAWLRGLRLDGEARTSVGNARDVQELRSHFTARAGVAAEAAERSSRGLGETGFATSLSRVGLETNVPPLGAPVPTRQATVAPAPIAPPLPESRVRPERSTMHPERRNQLEARATELKRSYRRWAIGVVAFFVAVPLAGIVVIAALAGGDDDTPGGDDETPTSVPTARSTPTPEPTSPPSATATQGPPSATPTSSSGGGGVPPVPSNTPTSTATRTATPTQASTPAPTPSPTPTVPSTLAIPNPQWVYVKTDGAFASWDRIVGADDYFYIFTLERQGAMLVKGGPFSAGATVSGLPAAGFAFPNFLMNTPANSGDRVCAIVWAVGSGTESGTNTICTFIP